MKGKLPMSKTLLVVGMTVMTLSFPVVANAQVCKTDQDCGKGWTCKASTVIPTAPVCEGKACDSKVDVTPPTPQSYCEPSVCQVNADCPASMVCHSETHKMCKGGASVANCPPDAPDCKPTTVDKETTCTSETISRCAYPWQLPCSTDVDCGAGFVCDPSTTITCSGSKTGGATSVSGSTGTVSSGLSLDLPTTSATDGGAATPRATCETTTSFPGRCRVVNVECKVDSDCPTEWSCKEFSVAVQPTEPSVQPQPTPGGMVAIGGAMATGGRMASKDGAMGAGGSIAIATDSVATSGDSMGSGGKKSTSDPVATGAVRADGDGVPTAGSVTGPTPMGGSTSQGIEPPAGGSITTPVIDKAPTVPQMICVSPLGAGYGWGGQTYVTANGTKGSVSDEGIEAGGPTISLPTPTAPPVVSNPVDVTNHAGGESAKAEAGGGCTLSGGTQSSFSGFFLLGLLGFFFYRMKTRR